MRQWWMWLALATAVCAYGSAPAATGRSASDRSRSSVAPSGRDSDHDGLADEAEKDRYHTDPRKRDTDRDGLIDGAEIRRFHTNPRKPDTDGDGYGDRIEISKGNDPRSPRDRPGFPGADNTGVPPRKALSAYAGPSTISTAGTVIDGKMLGCIRISAPGVVIRNSKISCSGSSYAVLSGDGDYSGTPLLLEDSEIDCRNSSGTAVGEANITARRLNIHSCENGFDINQNVTVEDSYIHDLYNTASSHSDGIQFGTGHLVNGQPASGVVNVTIRHNTIYGMGADGSFGTSAIIDHSFAANTNILIDSNLLAGGAVALYCSIGFTGTDYRVTNNHFSTKFKNTVGYYGLSSDCSDQTQSGNVIHQTGKPVSLP